MLCPHVHWASRPAHPIGTSVLTGPILDPFSFREQWVADMGPSNWGTLPSPGVEGRAFNQSDRITVTPGMLFQNGGWDRAWG